MKMSKGGAIRDGLGARIKHYRLQAKMSQQDLADALKPTYNSGTAISLIESGARGVDANDLPTIAKALGINVTTLLGEEEKTPDFSTALRADTSLSKRDKDDVMDFYNYVKKRQR